MRQLTTSAENLKYKNLRTLAGSHYEVLIRRDAVEYGMDKLINVGIQSAVFDESGPKIGGVQSAQCNLEFYETNSGWPRMASFVVWVRVCNANNDQQSEYVPLGTFYTDERNDEVNGKLRIVAFDGMLRLEQSWTDKIPLADLPSNWPITAKAWATMIQNAGIVQFADLTQLNDTVPFIGLRTSSTVRDILKDIAAVHGGNWQMVTRVVNIKTKTTREELTLIPLFNAQTPDIDLSKSVKNLTTSPALNRITKVRLESEAGTIVESETQDSDETDYQLHGNAEFADSTGIANLCLGRVASYVYRPFEASGAIIDPLVEVGDAVKINGTVYQLMSADWKINAWPTANISAPYDQEVDHEYTIPNAQAKALRKTLEETDARYLTEAKFSTEIQQTESQIYLAAQSVLATKDELQNLQDQIDGKVETYSGNYVPALNNSPANGWVNGQTEAEHIGDLFFINSDAQIPEAGTYYRFEENNGVYGWQPLSDSALTEALTKAAAALAAAEEAGEIANDAADEAALKGRIWLIQPSYPYSVGDLWFDSTTPGQADILTCTSVTPTTQGGFSAADWRKLNKYIDEADVSTYIENSQIIQYLESQLDGKAETYYQADDPISSWVGPDGNPLAAIAGIAIAGISVVGIKNSNEHKGDLWYRTTDNTTWHFDGTKWEQQNVPNDVFDRIDGKAQVFVSTENNPTPTPPYFYGDLWFTSDRELFTCIREQGRQSGSYVSTDWAKKNKYTDDTAANAVGERLTTFQSEFTVQPNQIRAEVEKRVIADHDESKASFGWLLDETSHTWYSNDQEVMKVNSSGLEVKGKITATSGLIGDCSIDSNGKLIVGLSNLNEPVVLSSRTETQYYLSSSSDTKTGGSWKTEIPTWSANKYIWTRNRTITRYSNSATDTYSYSPNEAGVYDRTITEALAKSTSAEQAASNASKRQQTIYHSVKVGATTPTVPNAWVTNDTGGQNVWTNVRPTYDTANNGYKALYVSTQRETVSGTISCTTPKLDVTTTIIDGANIITGSITASKLSVTELSALGATIGGFTIRSSTSQGVTTGSIAYGKTSLNDSNAGVYVGTDGISLSRTENNSSKKLFSVSTTGALYADFENGTIKIGEKMNLTGSGNNSTLTIGGFTIGSGSIYTNSQDSYSGSAQGVHLSASGIRLGDSFHVDANGNLIANNAHLNGSLTIGGNTAITQNDLYNAINQSAQNYSTWNGTSTSFGNATNSQSTTVPAYFRAQQIVASSSFYSAKYTVNTGNDSTEYDLEDHYHTFTAQDDGKVLIGPPSKTQGFFNIADTAYFNREVSAIKATSILISRETADEDISWNATQKKLSAQYTLTAKNAENEVVLERTGQTISIPATKAFNAGQDYGVTVAKPNYIDYTPESSAGYTVNYKDVAKSGNVKTAYKEGGVKKHYISPAYNLEAGHKIENTKSNTYSMTGTSFYIDVSDIIPSYTLNGQNIEINEDVYENGYLFDGVNSKIALTGRIVVDNNTILINDFEIGAGPIWSKGKDSGGSSGSKRTVQSSSYVAGTNYTKLKVTFTDNDTQEFFLPEVWNSYISENTSVYDVGFWAGYNYADGGGGGIAGYTISNWGYDNNGYWVKVYAYDSSYSALTEPSPKLYLT